MSDETQEIKRYNAGPTIYESEDGMWVDYDDHEKIESALREQVEQLKREIEELKVKFNQGDNQRLRELLGKLEAEQARVKELEEWISISNHAKGCDCNLCLKYRRTAAPNSPVTENKEEDDFYKRHGED